jgi:hypothetical protein
MHSKALAVVTLAIAAVSTAGCRKSSERERREAERAAERVEEKSDKAVREAIEETNDYLAAVRREQLDLRGRLQDEIDWIDKKLLGLKVELREDGTYAVDPNAKEADKINQLVRRRQLLDADVRAVEESDPRNWTMVKTRVEKDIGPRRLRGRI